MDHYTETGQGHRSILVGSGTLRDSVTREVEGDAWSVLVGATMEYAAVHQFGATIRPRTARALAVPGIGMLRKATIPARPYLGVSREDAGEIASLATAFLAGRIQ
jgi:phage gpG-like protein